jgi:outer membrane protein insertion porin family
VKDKLDNRMRPSRGERFILSQDIAGLGGSVKYLRTRANYDRYWRLPANFILNVGGEVGNIFGWGGEDVRLVDRFYLGEPRFRGFGIRGVGPRIIRKGYDKTTDTVDTNKDNWYSDAIGGQSYYLGRVELELPLGSGGRELGLRPSVFMDVGGLWDVALPDLFTRADNIVQHVCDANGQNCVDYTTPGFIEEAAGSSANPRVSVGVGVSWNSPFGPFRFDLAKALKKVEGDETQIFQFNIGTQF